MAGQPLQIDLHAILEKRLRRHIPAPLVRPVERLIKQCELNEVLRVTHSLEGSRFAEAVLKHFNISLTVKGLDNVPRDRRLIFASNHPLGGLDGISIISVLGSLLGDDNVRFLVNDILMNVRPLAGVFLPINKYGSQGRAAAADIAKAYEGPGQIIIFPAGLVSRLQPGGIADLTWNKAFVAKAVQYQRDIVPMHFIGLNRRRFYRIARLRKRLGIRVNLEQVLLPSEVVASRNASYTIVFGQPIPWQQLRDSGKTYPELAEEIKQKVYLLR